MITAVLETYNNVLDSMVIYTVGDTVNTSEKHVHEKYTPLNSTFIEKEKTGVCRRF